MGLALWLVTRAWKCWRGIPTGMRRTAGLRTRYWFAESLVKIPECVFAALRGGGSATCSSLGCTIRCLQAGALRVLPLVLLQPQETRRPRAYVLDCFLIFSVKSRPVLSHPQRFKRLPKISFWQWPRIPAEVAWRNLSTNYRARWTAAEGSRGFAETAHARIAAGIIVPYVQPKFRLRDDVVFFCIGSCFAPDSVLPHAAIVAILARFNALFPVFMRHHAPQQK